MGAQLSVQEKFFVEAKFNDVISASVAAMGEANATKTNEFALKMCEWEAIITACVDIGHIDSVSQKLEKTLIGSFAEVKDQIDFGFSSPLLYFCAHIIAYFDGPVSNEQASSRIRQLLTAMNENVVTVNETTRSYGFTPSFFWNCYEALFEQGSLLDIIESLRQHIVPQGSLPIVGLLTDYLRVASLLRLIEQQKYVDSSSLLDECVSIVRGARARVSFEPQVFSRVVARINAASLQCDLAAMLQQPQHLYHHVANVSPVSWDNFQDHYIGQESVVRELKQYFLSRSRGVVKTVKPAVFVLFGPSGHGKTELAKLVARVLHNSADLEQQGKLVSLHMPSFCTRDSIYSLVDPPAAHVGEGMLLSAIRRNPSAVVILDEFEKSTSDAVQNVWLSAFQKDGILRSLKEASRSASTVQTVFVLTCNTADSRIIRDREAYLKGTKAQQQILRDSWTELCIATLKSQFGEPFVNRVDKFFPFVPYTMEEKEEFAWRQLCAISHHQFSQGRSILFAPSVAHLLACKMTNFHNCATDQILQKQLLEISDPQQTTKQKVLIATQHDMDDDSVAIYSEKYITSLPDSGKTFVSTFFETDFNPFCKPVEKPSDTIARPNKTVTQDAAASAKGVQGKPQVQSATRVSVETAQCQATEKEMEKAVEKEVEKEMSHIIATQRETLLAKELDLTKTKLLEAEKEIVFLKDTIKDLETVLAVMVMFAVFLLCLLSLFISFSTLMILVGAAFGTLYLLVQNFAQILKCCLRGFWRFAQSHWKIASVLVVLCGYLIAKEANSFIRCPT